MSRKADKIDNFPRFGREAGQSLAALPLVRCASLRGFEELVGELGGDATEYLELAGLSGVDISDEERLIPTRCLSNALELAANALHIDDFGLRLSLKQDISILGALALRLQNAPSLLDALTLFQTELHQYHDHTSNLEFRIENQLLYLQHTQSIPNSIGHTQVTLLGYGFAANMGRQLLDPPITPRAIYFPHAQPKKISLYKTVFKTDLYFNQPFTGAVLDLNKLMGSIKIKPFQINNIERFLKPSSEPGQSLGQNIKLLMIHLMADRKCQLEDLADAMGISKRTLQRRLKKEGYQYSTLLTEVRKEVAVTLMHRGDLNFGQISEQLGFTDSAVFSRAFREWFGCTAKYYIKHIAG